MSSSAENKAKTPKSTYLIKQLEKENILFDKIKTSFDDPNEYLSIQPNMIIGRR